MSQAKSNKMGVVQLTILTMVNMMGSGIIMLPTKLAEVGTISIISWLVTAVGSMALAWAFAKCGMFSRKSGGMGGYAEYAFGKSGNFMANYTYGVSLLIANVAIAISAVGYGTELLGASLSPVQIGLATIGVLWICTVANFGGARITGQISSITVWGVIIPVVGLCIIGWFWFSPTLYVDSWNPHHAPFFSAVGSSIAMTLWAFLGLESACANTDVVENPERNVPTAHSTQEDLRHQPWPKIVFHPQLLRLNAGIFFLHCVQMAVFVVIPTRLVTMGLSVTHHWWIYLPAVLIGFACMVKPIAWADKNARTTDLLRWCIVMMGGVFLLFTYLIHSVWEIAFLMTLFFICFNILEATLPGLISRSSPKADKGFALGVYNTTQSFGLFAGGALGGWLAQNYTAETVFFASSFAMLLWFLLARGLEEPSRSHRHEKGEAIQI